MKITELTTEQKISFCRTMAACGFYEETDSAYSNALDCLGIDEPLTEEFSYTDGMGGELYSEVEEAMTKVLYLQLIFIALYNPENFKGLAKNNRGYEFAISMLNDLKSINSDKEFLEFIDSIGDA
jgi:hypothetical protein